MTCGAGRGIKWWRFPFFGIITKQFPVERVAHKDIAVFGLFPDFNVGMVGPDVALTAGIGVAGNSHIERVLWMAGITFAHALVGPEMTNVVALLASMLCGDGGFKDSAIEGCGKEDHCKGGVFALAELIIFSFMTGCAFACSWVRGNDEAIIMLGIIPITILSGVAPQAVDSVLCVL